MVAQFAATPAEYNSPMQPCGVVDKCDGEGGIGAALNTDLFGVATDDDGPSHDAAMKGPERTHWIAGEDEEMSKLERFEAYLEVPEDSLSTWDRVKRRARDVIDTLWVLKRKRGADGEILEWKARCVINGRQQLGRGTDVETFSSTVRASTFKTFCAVSCCKGRKRCTFDVSGAYLQGVYEDGEVVYARPPPGYRTHDTRGVPVVWKMLRPLYGQADAGRIWQRTIHKQFMKQGYTRSEYDPCYYYKHYPDGGFMGICLYVDDGFCDMTHDCAAAEADLTALAQAFDIKVKRETDYFLGTNVEDNSPSEMKLSAMTYIRSMVKKYIPGYYDDPNVAGRPRYPTPADAKLDRSYEAALERPPPIPPKEVTAYGSLVGALIYAIPCGRPDIAYAVGILARCLTFPTADLMTCALRVLTYLEQNAMEGLTFDGSLTDASVLHAYSDSNWTSSHSTTGFMLVLAGVTICYSSKRQKCIALSSTEAELIAASAAGAEIVYHRGLLAEMGLPQEQPTTLYVDNAGAVELAKDAKTCHRSRHVLRRFFKVREWQHAGELTTKWIATEHNLADMLTKSTIAPTTFTKFKEAAMHIVQPAVTFVNVVVGGAFDMYANVNEETMANALNAFSEQFNLGNNGPLVDDDDGIEPEDPCDFCQETYCAAGNADTCKVCGMVLCHYCWNKHACFDALAHYAVVAAALDRDDDDLMQDDVISMFMLNEAGPSDEDNTCEASPACAAALSLGALASAPTIIPAQALARAEAAYADKTLGEQQIRELAVAYGCGKLKAATINAIHAVIGRNASPPSHNTDKEACETAEPKVGHMTFKRWKAKLYGAD